VTHVEPTGVVKSWQPMTLPHERPTTEALVITRTTDSDALLCCRWIVPNPARFGGPKRRIDAAFTALGVTIDTLRDAIC